MKTHYRLIRRGRGHGTFYCVNSKTGKRTSLGKANKEEARQIVDAKNQAERQPMLNLQLAKAYLTGSDSELSKRTWQHALETLTETKQSANKERWHRVAKDRALAQLLPKIIVETQAEHILKVLQLGTVSTNVFLRRLYNFCVDMNWLPWPLVPKRQWPVVRFQDKRAITPEEHCQIVDRETSPERKAFYQLAWHLGASQSDLAHLQAEDVDWPTSAILGFQEHDIAPLIAAKMLNPLGKPAPNAPKYFASVDILAAAQDREWLSQATRSLSKYWQGKNARKKDGGSHLAHFEAAA
ncbi:MAG: hypothetical protein WC003_11500 [Terrimicrobiaceae bacterium]